MFTMDTDFHFDGYSYLCLPEDRKEGQWEYVGPVTSLPEKFFRDTKTVVRVEYDIHDMLTDVHITNDEIGFHDQQRCEGFDATPVVVHAIWGRGIPTRIWSEHSDIALTFEEKPFSNCQKGDVVIRRAVARVVEPVVMSFPGYTDRNTYRVSFAAKGALRTFVTDIARLYKCALLCFDISSEGVKLHAKESDGPEILAKESDGPEILAKEKESDGPEILAHWSDSISLDVVDDLTITRGAGLPWREANAQPPCVAAKPGPSEGTISE